MPMIADESNAGGMELIADDGDESPSRRSRGRKHLGFRTLERGRIPDDVKVVWKPHFGSQSLALSSPAKETLYHGPRGPGKCLPVGELVPTRKGWVAHGDLRAGDEIYGSDGHPILVLETFAVEERECYRLEFNDGSSITASDNHLWQVSYDRGVPRNWKTVETSEIARRMSLGFPVRFPRRAVLDGLPAELPSGFDFYMLGAWVGDGSGSVKVRKPTGRRTKVRYGRSCEFGSCDSELVESAKSNGFRVRRKKDNFTWMIGSAFHCDALKTLGLWGMKSDTKFVPSVVLGASVEQRLAFLQGLCDTDATTANCGARFTTVSERLATDVVSLIRSLGGFCRRSTWTPKETDRQKQVSFLIDFTLPEMVPFRLSRKVAKFVKPERMGWLNPKVWECVPVGVMKVSCIRVNAPDSLYVAGTDMLVTHNTDCQLMRFRRNVGVGYGHFWRGIIFDVEYRDLEDIVAKSLKWFPQFEDGAEFKMSAKDYKWVWPTGEQLLFRAGSTVGDYNKFHGHEYTFLGFNELCKQPTQEFYDIIKSCNRSSFKPEIDSPDLKNPLPPIPLEVFCTANPHGAGHSWVKRYFIDAGEPGEIVKTSVKILSPTTRQVETVTTTKTHIFGHWIENGRLPDAYIAGLAQITDENRRKAWAHGDWNVTAGGALDDVWDHRYVRKPRFKIPPQWKKDRTFDWGSTVPFYCAWWAEADGSEIEIPWGEGKTIWWGPPRGSLIMFNEWYGSTSWTSNVGLRLGPKAVAQGIAAREKTMREKEWIVGEVKPGAADNQIHNQNDADTDSIAKRMAAEKIRWTESDKSPGSRKNGLELMRDMLRAAVTGDGPGIFFMDNCQAALNILPTLQRDMKDPDDAASDGQDHPWDAVRYRVLDRKRTFGAIETRWYGGA